MTALLLLAAAAATVAPLADLNGDWRTLGDRPVRVSYRSISNDLATVETWKTQSGRETMTVYVADGSTVQATHYCGQGNLATLAGAAGTNAFDLSFRSAQGVDPGEGVLVHLKLVRDGDRLQRIETYRDGSKDSVDVIEFVREPAR